MSTSITVRNAAVPLRVVARPAGARLGTDPIVLVSRARHPKWTRITTQVTCSDCTYRVNRRTGRVVVTAGTRTTRITITVTATARRADSMYGPHIWTRTWVVRR